MEKVRIIDGDFKGLVGEAVYFKEQREYSVSIPNRKKPLYKDLYNPESLKIIESFSPSILDKKEFVRLHETHNEVQIIGCKGSCNSVWCSECYKRKGGSKRFAKRLAELDYRATRQVVLTVDSKKFGGCGRSAFEIIKSEKAIPQFIHNLKRTSNVKIVDWVWVLEWHEDGAPHWHLFIETEKGKKGKIGNEILLKHWHYGLVFESYIRSENHWKRFTDYFSNNGYFNPKQSTESKNKKHQLELPEWAKKITYRIRKTGSMAKKKAGQEIEEENLLEEKIGDETENIDDSGQIEPSTYKEILKSCGATTICEIRRGNSHRIWKKFNIPYKDYKEYPGEYVPHAGYVVQMNLDDFFIFMGLYYNENFDDLWQDPFPFGE